MVSFLDRFFTDDVSTPKSALVLDFHPHPRIRVQVYDDWPMYLAVYHVDEKPVLKENMVENPNTFYQDATKNRNFQAFILEYGQALENPC